mgnify:CR=1 FL=1
MLWVSILLYHSRYATDLTFLRIKLDQFFTKYILANFSYDHLTGEIFYTKQTHRGKPRDLTKPAGFKDDRGYARVNIRFEGNHKQFHAHRIAWLLFYKEWPPLGLVVDHINRVKHDNRIENLRVVDFKTNSRNSSAQKNTKSKYKGVTRRREPGFFSDGKPKKVWEACLNVNNKKIRLGVFREEKEAALAYDTAAKLHGVTTNQDLNLIS